MGSSSSYDRKFACDDFLRFLQILRGFRGGGTSGIFLKFHIFTILIYLSVRINCGFWTSFKFEVLPGHGRVKLGRGFMVLAHSVHQDFAFTSCISKTTNFANLKLCTFVYFGMGFQNKNMPGSDYCSFFKKTTRNVSQA